jgi:hypothetical protein
MTTKTDRAAVALQAAEKAGTTAKASGAKWWVSLIAAAVAGAIAFFFGGDTAASCDEDGADVEAVIDAEL